MGFTCFQKLLISCFSLLISSTVTARVAPIAERLPFTPWYTGPIITAPATNLPPGQFNINPYLYLIDTHGLYDEHWHYASTPHMYGINPFILFQAGILERLDITATFTAYYNHKVHRNSIHVGDTTLSFGIQLCNDQKETWIPSARLILKESFPTGKYQRLNPLKESGDVTGVGSFTTTLGLNLSKQTFWIPYHPIHFRLNFSYTFSAPVHVHGFNVYGGGYGTRGKLTPGQSLFLSGSFEFSLTQQWVFACDLAYFYGNSSGKFSGNPGVIPNEDEFIIADTKQDVSAQFSLAPAIEYNFNDSLGIIFGSWFTFAGRKSVAFVSAVAALTYTW